MGKEGASESARFARENVRRIQQRIDQKSITTKNAAEPFKPTSETVPSKLIKPKVQALETEGIGKSVNINRDSILDTATASKKGGETVVGHALQKHAGRNPDIWGKMKGGPYQINQTALKHLQEIVDSPGDFLKLTNNRGITFLEKKITRWSRGKT
ncbi:MAG: hypothetical protein ACQEXV_13400 [Bacillota bacterium]